MRYPIVIQHDEMDCGAACLAMIGKYYGLKLPLIKYRDLLCFDNNGTTMYDIVYAAEKLKFEAICLKGKFDDFVNEVISQSIILPCIALIQSDCYFHFVVVYKVKNNKIKYADPSDGLHTVDFFEFKNKYKEGIITLRKSEQFTKLKTNIETLSLLVNQIFDNKKLYVRLIVCSVFIIILGLLGSVLIELMISSAFEHIHIEFNELLHRESYNIMNVIEMISHNLKYMIVLLIVIYGLRLLVDIFKSFTITFIACDLGENILEKYFDHMMNMPLNRFGRKRAGEYISRFGDVRKLNNLFADVVTSCVLNIIIAIGFGAALLALNFKLFLVTMFFVINFLFFSLIFQRTIKRMNYTVLQNNSKMISIVEESIKGMEFIKTNNIIIYIKDKFKSCKKKYFQTLSKFANLSFSHNNIANWLASFGVLIILYLGITLCRNGEMEIDALLIYYIILSYFFPAIQQLIYIQPEISESIIAINRVEDILGTDREDNCEGEEQIDTFESVELVNVSYRFGIRNQILKDISLRIEKGDKIKISGDNGSGKSTLAHIIVGNYKDMVGKILYNGKEKINYFSVKEKITYVNQEVFLFHDSIYNNIVMGKEDVSKEDFIRICEITGVSEFVNNYPEGYDYILNDNGMNLSGGQRRKIALARALLRDTEMFIFDESTSNLDEDSKKMFLKFVEQNLIDKTILFISHDNIFDKYVNKSYKLEGGKLFAC